MFFNDSEGRGWGVVLSVGTNKRVKAATGIDLSNAGNAAVVVGLAADRAKLADVLWAVLETQAKASGIDRASFDAGLDGPALDAGAAALREGFINYALPNGREALRASVQKVSAAYDGALAAYVDALKSPEVDAKIEGMIGDAKTKILAELAAVAV
jgi:hypothetical protein